MYKGPSVFDKSNNIRYEIVDSQPNHESSSFFGNNDTNNEALVLAVHSSFLCFKIALCVLL